MLDRVQCEIKTFDNYIQITPTNGIRDNAIYEIKLRHIESADCNSEINNQTITVYTKISPSYSTVEAVKALLYNCGVPDSVILYNIREASKYVEYVTNKKYNDNEVPYNVFQYVKYKAAYDSLIGFAVNGVANGITEGTMGDVSYKKEFRVSDINGLLKTLKIDLDKWYDALFGYIYTGPARPAIMVKSSYILDLKIRNDDPPRRTYTR